MTGGIPALTEKEKETLRLLVNGYDAKSMARQLGLSVHTVNERLRDARRKLAVSSSREAARQLRAAEGTTPELLRDKPLGDAATSDPAQVFRQPAQGNGKIRRTGWIAGGIAMTISLAVLALSVLADPSQTLAVPLSTATMAATPAVSPTPASETAAIDAARQFLALIDRDDWTTSWQATHQSFKLLNTVEWWSESSRKVRGEFGMLKSRELQTVNFAPAPPNGYWTITFKASYSKQSAVVETLSLASEDGNWKVVGITVE